MFSLLVNCYTEHESYSIFANMTIQRMVKKEKNGYNNI